LPIKTHAALIDRAQLPGSDARHNWPISEIDVVVFFPFSRWAKGMVMHISTANSALLSSLSDDLRRNLLALCQRRNHVAGSTIYVRGEAGASMMIIETGRVEISVMAANGRKSVLNHVGPGEVVGEVAMLDRGERSADVVAASDVTALHLTRADFGNFLTAHPEVALAIIAEICLKVRNASEMFENQAQISASARLARCLLRIAEKWGQPLPDGSIQIDQPFSQSDLGEFSGMARENVNRHLKSWAGDGILHFEGGARGFRVLAPDKLSALAEP